MNKKIILILAAIFGTIAAKAQTEKGNQFLGGNIGFGTGSNSMVYTNSYNTNGTNKTTSFSIGPTYSYFIVNNLDLGAGLSYSTSHTNYAYDTPPVSPDVQNTVGNYRSYSAGVYLRKYFLFNKFGFRTGPFANYSNSRSNTDFTDQTNNYSQNYYNINAGVGLDLVYFPTKRIALTAGLASLDFNHEDNKQLQEHDTSNSFQFNFINSGLEFTVLYCFGK
jgi:hypothetical protein